jgi:hypothetical protein
LLEDTEADEDGPGVLDADGESDTAGVRVGVFEEETLGEKDSTGLLDAVRDGVGSGDLEVVGVVDVAGQWPDTVPAMETPSK